MDVRDGGVDLNRGVVSHGADVLSQRRIALVEEVIDPKGRHGRDNGQGIVVWVAVALSIRIDDTGAVHFERTIGLAIGHHQYGRFATAGIGLDELAGDHDVPVSATKGCDTQQGKQGLAHGHSPLHRFLDAMVPVLDLTS
jgi:hypothetical protein